MNVDTFQPRNGTQTSVLILQRKTQEQKDTEEKSGKMADYNIFMAMIEKVGHDKRGNPLFKRDKEGNEILVPDTNSVLVLGETGDGQRTVSHEQKVKVEVIRLPMSRRYSLSGKSRRDWDGNFKSRFQREKQH